MPTVKATFTADISQFRQSLAQATTAVTAFDRSTSQVNRDLARFGNQFSGATIQRQALTIARAISDIGGVTKLTDAELRRHGATINEALQKYQRLGQEAPASLRTIGQAIDTLTAKAPRLEAQVSTLAGLGGSLKNGLGALASGLGIGIGAGLGLGALTALGSTISDIAGEATRLGPLQQSFERLQGGATNAASSLLALRHATRGLVSEADLLQSANKASLLGLQQMGIDFAEVARIATVLGRAMGQDATKSVDDLTTALSRMSPQILDNLGLKVDLTKAYEDYAKGVKKAVDQLTEEEKKLAFAKAAMESARAKAKELGDIQLTVAEQSERIAKAFGDISAQAITAGNRSATFAGVLGKLADAMDRIRNAGLGASFRTLAGEVGEGMENLARQFGTPFSFGTALFGMAGQGLQRLARPGDAAAVYQQSTGSMPQVVATGGGGVAGPSAEELKRRAEEARKFREEIAKLTGATMIRDVERLAKQINLVGAAKIPTEHVEELAKQLMEARDAARETGRAIANDVVQALNKLQIESRRIEGLNPLFIQGSIDAAARNAEILAQRTTGSLAGFSGLINSTNPTAGMLIGLTSAATVPPVVLDRIARAYTQTKNWRVELQGVAQAFARLAQVAGPSMDSVSRVLGIGSTAGDATRELLTALGKAFKQLGEDFADSRAGQIIGGGISSALSGYQLGMGAGSRGSAVTQGVIGGGLSGMAFGPVGMGVGMVVGGISAYFGQRKAEEELRKLKDLQAQQLVADYGSLDNLLDTVGRLGMNQQSFLERFYGDPQEFATAVAELNAELTRERREVDALTKSLQAVSRAQGVLTRQQVEIIRNVRPGGPAEEIVKQFSEQQRQQAEGGIARAVAALTPSLSDQEIADLTRGVSDQAERTRVIEAELARRSKETLSTFSIGAKAAASGLFVAFSEAVRQGESAVEVLKRLQTPIQDLKKLYERAGMTPGEGFQNLQVLSGIATDKQTAPAVELASGLGQALAGFANTGLLSPALFGELANGIGQAHKQLELFGKGGLEAARLMQPGLQNIWQMIQNNPKLRDELDDTTKALLDFAEQSGLVGKDWQPESQKMLDRLGDLIDRIGDLIEVIGRVPGIDIPVTYTPGTQPGAPGVPAPDYVTFPEDPNYGRGRPELPEGLTPGGGRAPAEIPLSSLRRFSDRAVTIVNVTQLDGREVARSVNRYQGDERRLMGVA